METTNAEKIRKDIALLASEDDDTSHGAERRLVEAGGEAVPLLIEAAGDYNPLVRCRVAWALGKIGDPRALKTVLDLTRDPNDDVRYDAVMALGDFGDERAIDPLIQLVVMAAEEEVLSGAAGNALVEIGEPAVEPLLGVLQTGSSDARVLAAYTLGRIGSKDVIEPLAELLEDPNEWVRIAGVESLARMAESLSPGLSRQCVESIEKCLDDPVERVRDTARQWSVEIRKQIGMP